MINIQREIVATQAKNTIKIKEGQQVTLLHCVDTDDTFIKMYDVEQCTIVDPNATNGYFTPTLLPINYSTYANQLLEGYVVVDGNPVFDPNAGQALTQKYQVIQTTAQFDQEVTLKNGAYTEFLQVTENDPNGAMVGIANFIKMNK